MVCDVAPPISFRLKVGRRLNCQKGIMNQTKSILFIGGILALCLSLFGTRKHAIAHAPKYHIQEQEEASEMERQNGDPVSKPTETVGGDSLSPNPTQSSEVLSLTETHSEIDPFQGMSESLFLLILASPFVLNFLRTKIHSPWRISSWWTF